MGNKGESQNLRGVCAAELGSRSLAIQEGPRHRVFRLFTVSYRPTYEALHSGGGLDFRPALGARVRPVHPFGACE